MSFNQIYSSVFQDCINNLILLLFFRLVEKLTPTNLPLFIKEKD